MGMIINRRRVCGEKGLLPSGYTQLEYIESTGTQWIDTGYCANLETDIELEYYHTQLQEFIFGERKDAGTAACCVFCNKQIKEDIIGFGTNETDSPAQRFTTPIRLNTWLNVKLNKHYKEISDSTTTNIFNDEKTLPFTTSYTLKIAKTPTTFPANYPLLKGRVRKLIIKDNGELFCNMIPAIRKLDNIVGMYDTVSQTFFINAGTGNFIAGPEVQ